MVRPIEYLGEAGWLDLLKSVTFSGNTQTYEMLP